ncbi:hypothetical protein T492DRAFT_917198, partial [Pavlovales sp. CCMP2436]
MRDARSGRGARAVAFVAVASSLAALAALATLGGEDGAVAAFERAEPSLGKLRAGAADALRAATAVRDGRRHAVAADADRAVRDGELRAGALRAAEKASREPPALYLLVPVDTSGPDGGYFDASAAEALGRALAMQVGSKPAQVKRVSSTQTNPGEVQLFFRVDEGVTVHGSVTGSIDSVRDRLDTPSFVAHLLGSLGFKLAGDVQEVAAAAVPNEAGMASDPSPPPPP